MMPTADNSASAEPADLGMAPIVVATRFSFVGQSGWQSDASRDPALLFQPDRLRRRLELFSSITLPSLAAQSDSGFHHLILTSDQMPDWALAELTAQCQAAYGAAARFSVLAEPPGAARRSLRLFMQRSYSGPAVVQVVLDDDDGLATDFIAEMRRQIGLTQTKTPEITEALPFMISFPQGYGLVLRAETEQMAEARVYLHSYPYINLGLTMIGSPGGKNIFAIDHRAAPRKHGGRLVPGKPMFLRTLHGFNDSRVTPTQKWKLLENWREDAGLQARFPWLFAATADWNNG